jgi:hypothetical protein
MDRAAREKPVAQSSSLQSNLEAKGSYLQPMILAAKSIIRTTNMDNKKPIAITGRRKLMDTAAIPNLPAINKIPEIIQKSQIREKYLGIHLYLASLATNKP